MTPEDQYLTTKEVGRFLNLSHRTLENFRRIGKGPPYVRLERTIRYRWSDVKQWMQGGVANVI